MLCASEGVNLNVEAYSSKLCFVYDFSHLYHTKSSIILDPV